jgi:GNAT superfamily N-acetyltransferase
MTITVRVAEDRDIGQLVEMNRIVHDLHVAAEPTYFRKPEPGGVAELFRARLRQSEVRIWIASFGKVPVGYAVSVLRERPASAICCAQRCYELEEVGVSPVHRRKGVARALVERVLAEARAQAVPNVQLTCWYFNAEAQAAFEALGFRPLTVRFQREIG